MKAKKIAALFVAAAMTVTMIGCGNNNATTTPSTDTPATEEAAATDATQDDTTATTDDGVVDSPVTVPSIDFEDGSCSFIGVDKSVNSAAGDFTYEVADGVLKVTPQGGKPFVAIQMDALLGENVSKVASVGMEIGIKNDGDTFYAASGNIYAMNLDGVDKANQTWSVYLENANPKPVLFTLPAAGTEGSYLVVSMETDTAADNKGLGQSTLLIDNIVFFDANGNTLVADSSAEYVAAATGEDRSNLYGMTNAITVADLSGKGGAWSQLGNGITEDEFAALCLPGSVIEISYTSTTGNMWVVMPDSAAGWMRVGVGNCDGSGQEFAYVNNSKNIAQVTYEQLAAVLGDDASTWGQRIQCESDGDYEIFSVKIGQQAPNYCLTKVVDANLSGKGGAWSQLGDGLSEEAVAALTTPGSVVEISYTSATGECWIVMPDSAAGWMRVGVGEFDGSGQEYAQYDGSTCYITYDQIAAVCGDDASTWGSRIQVEASSDYEVYSVKIGQGTCFVPNNKLVDAALSGKGGAWSQLGNGLSEEAVAALTTPGSVVNISYTSATGECWIVMPDSAAGWMRVGVGDFDGSGQEYAVYNGSVCQITYDQIAAVCGDDPSTWGARIQVEASSDYEVFSVSIGQTE